MTSWDHPFFYEESKIVFNQEVEYAISIQQLKRTGKTKKNQSQGHPESKIVNINLIDKPCDLRSTVDDVDIKLILTPDEIFDILAEVHICNPHVLKSHKDLEEFTNVSVEVSLLHLFLKSCRTCNLASRNYWVSYNKYFTACEMGLISVVPRDSQFSHILIYIDQNSNYVLLRPLKKKSAKEVAFELFNIFCDFGQPTFLYCIQQIFFQKVYNVLFKLLPTMLGIRKNEEPLKLQKMTQQAITLLNDWMKHTDCANWVIGAHIVQWIMNTNKVVDTFVRSNVINGVIHSPYHALFGMVPNKELVNLNMTNNNDNNITKTKPKKSPEAKKLLTCSECKMVIYKVYLCHSCKKPCHFLCCKRYFLSESGICVVQNKCMSCAP